jgi:hypothetical protein
MPESLLFDVKQLVRLCLNDPSLRAEIMAALEAGPAPIRTACVHVTEDTKVFYAVLQTDREKAPDEPGFVRRDAMGWVKARLAEVVAAGHDAPTMTADRLAEMLANKP